MFLSLRRLCLSPREQAQTDLSITHRFFFFFFFRFNVFDAVSWLPMCLHGNDWARKLFERWQLRERLLLSSCLNLTQLLLSCQRKPDWKQDEMSSNDLGAVSQATGLVSVSCRRFTSHPRGPFSCFQGESALIYVLFCLLFFPPATRMLKMLKPREVCDFTQRECILFGCLSLVYIPLVPSLR